MHYECSNGKLVVIGFIIIRSTKAKISGGMEGCSSMYMAEARGQQAVTSCMIEVEVGPNLECHCYSLIGKIEMDGQVTVVYLQQNHTGSHTWLTTQ